MYWSMLPGGTTAAPAGKLSTLGSSTAVFCEASAEQLQQRRLIAGEQLQLLRHP